jgi:hypothetical protein
MFAMHPRCECGRRIPLTGQQIEVNDRSFTVEAPTVDILSER